MAMTDPQQTTMGWVIFIGALGMLFSMISVDLVALHGWNNLFTPEFVGTTIGHVGAVIAAFMGGKLIPAERLQTTRSTDVVVPAVTIVPEEKK